MLEDKSLFKYHKVHCTPGYMFRSRFSKKWAEKHRIIYLEKALAEAEQKIDEMNYGEREFSEQDYMRFNLLNFRKTWLKKQLKK